MPTTISGTATSFITFSRASTATRVNASGIIESVAANTPRLDYDPVTLAPRGLLVEEQRTNLLLRSAEFDNAAWTKSRSTVTANDTTSPSGGVDADKLIEDTATGTHRIYQYAAKAAASVTRTFSVYLKAAERTLVSIRVTNNTESVVASANVDLSAGTVASPTISGGSSISSATSSITFVGNGWYRCVITATFDATIENPAAFVFLRDGTGTTSYTGDGTSGIFVFGAQWEDGSFATSYIPTLAASATRSADVASVATSSFPYSATEGTLVAKVRTDMPAALLIGGAVTLAAGNGTDNCHRIAWYNMTLRGNTRVSTVNVSDISVAYTQGAISKGAYAFKENDFSFAEDGTLGTPDTSGSMPVGIDKMHIGSVNGSNALNGWISQITYIPRRLTNAELQTRST